MKGTVSGSYLTSFRVALTEIIFSNFYMRNTKESIKDEYQIPNCEEELVLLDFHPVEAAIYAEERMKQNPARQREICNHLLLCAKYAKLFEDKKWNFEEIRQIVAKEILTKPASYKAKLEQAENDLEKVSCILLPTNRL